MKQALFTLSTGQVIEHPVSHREVEVIAKHYGDDRKITLETTGGKITGLRSSKVEVVR